jgi:prepilin-type N-terminal cleavage/methylation domain-containing protein
MARSAGVVIRRRKGFTLVEVIVVLVILAILAAIAIPALTGYIDKAEDKKYIADARNHALAVRTALDSAYAESDFSSSPAAMSYLENGDNKYTGSKFWSVPNLSTYAGDAQFEYLAEASKLIGEADYVVDDHENLRADIKGLWYLGIFGPKGSDVTAINADGFVYYFYPSGYAAPVTAEKPIVIVTYRLPRMAASSYDLKADGDNRFTKERLSVVYDPNAGYEVYHYTQ